MNPLPEKLQTLVHEARAAMNNNAIHDLSMGRREAILWALGPYEFAPGNSDHTGFRRRVHLARLAVRRVLPNWQHSFPGNPLPERLLERAEAVSRNQPVKNPDSISKEVELAWDETSRLFDETWNLDAAVGLAAARALSLALWDGFTDSETPEQVDLTQADSPEFESNDVHCLACAVYAGGHIYPIAAATSGGSPEKRHEFWSWWLNTAIPEAYCSAT